MLFYFVRETIRGFLQAKLMTFVSIVTIAVTIFFLGIIVAGFINLQRWLAEASAKPAMVVFIQDAVVNDDGALKALLTKLRQTPGIDNLVYIDKEGALERFKKLYGTQMLDAVEGNPLPSSVEVVIDRSMIDNGMAGSVIKSIEQMSGVEGVNYSQDWVATLKRFRRYVLWGIVIMIPLLGFALHFMIANTIKLTIYARKDLITNMRYVGATNFYIKTPFVLEGILQGSIGGAMGVFLLSLVRLALSGFSLDWGTWHLFAGIFATGVVFGWVGSVSAVRRFLE